MSALPDQPTTVDAPPSFHDDPWKWEARMRAEMVHKLEDVEGIKDYSINQYIIGSAFRLAKQRDLMGKQVELWNLYAERLDWYRTDKKSVYEPREKIVNYAKAASLSDSEINDILRMAAPHGHGNVCYYYTKIDNLADEKNGIKTKHPPLKPRAKAPAPVAPPKPAPAAPIVPPTEQPSELDSLLGRERHTRPTPHTWSALTIKGTAIQARSAHSHFKTDLAIIDPRADANTVIRTLLSMDIEFHIEKFGVDITVQKLQAGLDTYGEEPPMPKTEQTASEAPAAASAAQTYLSSTTTLSGVPLADIVKELNKPWPSWSVFAIPGNQRAPKDSKGIKAGAVQARVNEIFGQENIGWRFATHPNTIVHYGEETHESKDEKTGEIKETLWYAVRVEMFIFEYVTIAPDGSKEWIQGSPLSDSHTNMTSRSAAYRGAMSSLLKQAVTRLGGLRNVATQGAAQQQAQGAAQKPPADSVKSHGEPEKAKPSGGMTMDEVKLLMQWADSQQISRADVAPKLGVKGSGDWAKWTLEDAKKKVQAA